MNLKLIQYRDPESPYRIYFWVNDDNVQVSPIFTNEGSALDWKATLGNRCPWDNWKPSKEML